MKTPKLQLNDTQRYVLKHLNLSQWYLKDIHVSSEANQQQTNVIDQLADDLLVSEKLSSTVNNVEATRLEIEESRVTDSVCDQDRDNVPQNIASLITENTIATANPRNKHLLVKPLYINAEKKDFIKRTDDNLKLEIRVDEQFTQLKLAHKKIAKDYSLSIEDISLNKFHHCDEMVIIHQCNKAEKMADLSSEQKLLSQILSVCNIDLFQCHESYFHKSIQPQFSKLPILTEHLKQEMAQINPKRIWVFGGEIAQHLLNIDYPLGYLMQNKQTIQFICSDKGQVTKKIIDLLVFPDLNYLLSIPKDKALVWDSIKSHVLTNN